MYPPAPCGAPARRLHARGQSAIEMAMVLLIFLTCLTAAIDIGIWSVESNAATIASEEGARIAAGAALGGPADVPNVAAVGAVKARLAAALFGTPVIVQSLPPGGLCPTADDVWKHAGGTQTVEVCAVRLTGVLAGYVQVRISGYATMVSPPGLGISFTRGTPIDVQAIVHTLTYTL